MNSQFRSYVTDRAFNLSLSKGQIHQLQCVINVDYDSAVLDSRFMCHLQALQRRGLVIHTPTKNDNLKAAYARRNKERAWKATKAGELAYQLLIEAGLIVLTGEKAVNE